MKTRAFKSRIKLRFELYLATSNNVPCVICFWVIWIDGILGWSEEVEGGEVFVSIPGAIRWKDWKDDRTDVSW